jgi:hypothetical protein
MHVILGPKPQQAQQRRERPAAAARAASGGAANVPDVNNLPSDRAEPDDAAPTAE